MSQENCGEVQLGGEVAFPVVVTEKTTSAWDSALLTVEDGEAPWDLLNQTKFTDREIEVQMK